MTALAPLTLESPPVRHYLMCPPTHYTVKYQINPWMHPEQPTDADLAMEQWENLRRTYLELGHTVDLIEPLPDYPDMVYAANGATVVDGVAYGARFTYPQRQGEAPPTSRGWPSSASRRSRPPRSTRVRATCW